MTLKKDECGWVLHSNWSEPETMYCRKKKKYKMVCSNNEPGIRERKYDSFCEEHMKKKKHLKDQQD